MIRLGRSSRPCPRVEFVAIPIAIIAAFLFRRESFGTSMGPDELSLLVMARSIAEGAFPYEMYWDVRAPLAYFIALPSALCPDAVTALATLRLLTVFVHAGAAWTFFCLFRRTLGAPAAAVGALVLLASANMADVHHLAMPNHFVMGVALAAFACLVAGIRGSRTGYFASAFLAGTLPWVMVQSGLVTLGLAGLVLFADAPVRRIGRVTWLCVAALPSAVIAATFFFSGPFDALLDVILLAPYGAIQAAVGYDFWSQSATHSRLPGSVPWVFVSAVTVGAIWFPRAARDAPRGSPLRCAGFLVVPAVVGFLAATLIRSLPSAEYFVEAAPAVAVFAAVLASRLWHSRLWELPWLSRRLGPVGLQVTALVCLGLVLAFPSDPWKKHAEPRTPLPAAYCDTAVQWVERLGPEQTVLDLSGICGLRVFDTGRALHPPFTYAGNWFGRGLSWTGDGPGGDVYRLREALAQGSTAGVVVANGLLLDEIGQRGWEDLFCDEWRLVWYREVPGHDAGFDRLAVFVRVEMLDEV